jgi:hypothetical protein
VHHAPAGGHAAGRDDDHRATPRAQRLRILGLVDDLGRMAHGLAFVRGSAGARSRGAWYMRSRVGGHRAVQVHGRWWMTPCSLSWWMQYIRLCARPTANAGITTTPPRAAVRLMTSPACSGVGRQGARGRRRWIPPPGSRPRDAHRWFEHRVVGPPDVAREQHRAPAVVQPHERRPCMWPERDRRACRPGSGDQGGPAAGGEQLQAALGVLLGVQRQRRACAEKPCRLAYSASSSCRWPLSGSRMRHRS